MKNLKDYIKECLATPLDVMGMGNLEMPNLSDNPGELSDRVGSGDAIKSSDDPDKPKKRKKVNRKD